MDTKEVKAALKSAREAIRAKDYKGALRHCKGILKKDKSNYNALVFVGVAAEGMDQSEQAINAYRKAIDVDPDNPLAWQGLCSFYEKASKGGYDNDLINVYQQLQQIHQSDKEKNFELGMKLAQLFSRHGKVTEAVNVYSGLLTTSLEPDVRAPIVVSIVDGLRSLEKLTDEQQQMLLASYDEMTAGSQQTKQDVWISYIKLLKKMSTDIERIMEVCTRCSKLYPQAVLPAEMTARILLDKSLQDKDISMENIDEELQKFGAMDGSSGYVNLLLGLKELRNQNYPAARDALKAGLGKLKTNLSGWLILCQVLQRLRNQREVYDIALQGQQLLETPNITFYGSRSEAKLHFLMYQAQCGVELGGTFLDKVQDIVTQLETSAIDNTIVLSLRVKILLATGQYEECLKILDDVPPGEQDTNYLVLKGQVLEQMSNSKDACQMFSQAVTTDDNFALGHYHLGRHGYEQHIKHSEAIGDSHTHLLKAAKLDPYYSNTFVVLGKYYANVNKDVGKAIRCYQKAYELDWMSEEAGCLLVDGLVSVGQEDKAVDILTSITKKSSAGSGKWAWLRLGLYQMSHDDPTSSIVSLQSALRADPKDVHCWECLGEAYMTRGSYTAALKVFTRATELDPTAMFCYYQMATIKQALGIHDEAVTEYKKILETNPTYIPALKGLGHTYLLMAKVALADFFHGRAVDYCQEAIAHLAMAATLRPDLSCQWKLLGDSCTIVAPVPDSKVSMLVPAKLITQSGDKEDKVKVTKPEILAIGARCYGMALKLQPDCSALWHDLGINYYYQSKMADKVKARLLVGKAVQSLQKALGLDTTNFKHWNALGVIAAGQVLNHLSLAQHCFIKSIEVEANNVAAWTNLGVLYLRNEEIKLAHEAFKVAQSLEPSYVACWVGQALVAETVGDDEAMDLFRHTTELGVHVEGAVGYGHWVCNLLQKTNKKADSLFSYAIHQMAAIPAASDALAKYLDRDPDDPVAYNLYGLLLERQGLYAPATDAFKRAIAILSNDAEKIQPVRINYARALCMSGQSEAGVEQYKKLTSISNLDVVCAYGLALYKTQDYDGSMAAYQQALSMANTDDDQSHIQATMGMVAYRKGDLETAKGHLFESFKSSSPSVLGLRALLSIGLLQRDSTLAAAASLELQKLSDLGPEVTAWIEHLAAEVHVMGGDGVIGKRNLQKSIHRHPDRPLLWRRLTEFLVKNESQCYSAAANCAMKYQVLTNDRGSTALLLGLSSLAAGRHSEADPPNKALSLIQKAVHNYPADTNAWFTLLSALYAELEFNNTAAMHSLVLSLTTNLMGRVEAELSASTEDKTRLQALHVWCVKQYILTLMRAGRTAQAEQFLQQAAWLYESDTHLQGLTAMFSQNFATLKKIAPADSAGFVYQLLISLYLMHGLVQEAEKTFHQWLQNSTRKSAKIVCLAKLAHFAFGRVLSEDTVERWSEVFREASSEVIQLDRSCGAVWLMQGILALADKRRANFAKRSLHQVLDQAPLGSLSLAVQVAREHLLAMYREKGDEAAIRKLLGQDEPKSDDHKDNV